MKQIQYILEQGRPDILGMSTEQQAVLAILATDKENEYPKYIKSAIISKDNHYFISIKARLSKKRIMNTNGKNSFLSTNIEIKLKSEKINYSQNKHRLNV